MRRYGAARAADWRQDSLRQRFGVLALIILAELAIVLLIILFGGSRVRETVSSAATSITFIENPAPPAATPLQRQSEQQAPAKPRPPTPPRPVPPIVLPTVREPLPYVPMSRADLAASDISKLGTAASGGGVGAGEAKTAAATGTGDGPGGVTLYNAEWVVEPTDAQLRPYLPRGAEAGSWALIACQTIAHNQVENCAQLGEGPRGSGLSKAMRLAAWQFKVRPPRIDGKPMVGAWVRIRIDFGKGKGTD